MTAAPSLLDYAIRAAEPGDRRFIIETTAKVRQPRDVTWTDWRNIGEPRALNDLVTGFARVAEADGIIVGFALWARKALAMLYVKREFRGCGIGLGLVHDAPPVEPLPIVQATPSWRRWARLHRIRWEEVR